MVCSMHIFKSEQVSKTVTIEKEKEKDNQRNEMIDRTES